MRSYSSGRWRTSNYARSPCAFFYETQRATDTVRNLLAFVEQPRPDKHPENLSDILTKALERKAYDLRSKQH